MKRKILCNRAKCLKCGDIIESKTRHDFQTCSCGNLSVDGGHFYLKRCFGPGMVSDNYEELSEVVVIPEEDNKEDELICLQWEPL